jgi:hypothetical protein
MQPGIQSVNPRADAWLLRRALAALFLLTAAEWSAWLLVLIRAYEAGGTAAAMVMSVAQLCVGAVAAPLGAAWMASREPAVALRLSFCLQGLALGILACLLSVTASMGWIVASACLATATITLSRPAHYRLIPRVLGRDGACARWNGASAAAEGLAVVCGPLLAAMLLARLEVGSVMIATALMPAAAALVLGGLPAGHGAKRYRVAGIVRVGATGTAFTALRRAPDVRTIAACVFGASLLAGAIDVLSVAFTSDALQLETQASGVLLSALGAGAVLGGSVLGLWRRGSAAMNSPLPGVLLASGSYALTSSSEAMLGAVLCLVLAGAGRALLDILARTTLQRRCGHAQLAAALGMQECLSHVALAVGAALALPAITIFGPRGAFVACAAALPVLWFLACSVNWLAASSAAAPGPSRCQNPIPEVHSPPTGSA